MDRRSEITNRFRGWHQQHTEGALIPYQPKFWILFWVTAAFSAGLYYFTHAALASRFGQDGWLLLSMGYLSLPLLVLRNLHLQAFIYLSVTLLSILG